MKKKAGAGESDLLRFSVPPPSDQLQRVARGLRHDLGNILTPIVAFGELLDDDPRLDEQSHSDVNAINQAAARASALIDTFQVAAGLSPVEHTQLSVLDLAEVLEESWSSNAVRARIILAVGASKVHSPEQADLTATADLRLMRRVMDEVSTNCENAKAQNALVSIGIDGDKVVVRISDDGPGVPPELLHTLAEPYVTTQHSASKGLGLSVINGIMKALRGELTLETDKRVGGFTVELTWPAAGVDEEIVIPDYLLSEVELPQVAPEGEAVPV